MRFYGVHTSFELSVRSHISLHFMLVESADVDNPIRVPARGLDSESEEEE